MNVHYDNDPVAGHFSSDVLDVGASFEIWAGLPGIVHSITAPGPSRMDSAPGVKALCPVVWEKASDGV